ncbi:hypothetical protein HPB47_021778 [Ixodes persulcatus]|uniref:Uncharacterized protein n=1 Tax=Ixodes persulcatus TaxID=34615 RepID=A0AC60QBL2_IXOPE|nr:hypothetical protein HPB47_021778 [Ixodes persulcatus]
MRKLLWTLRDEKCHPCARFQTELDYLAQGKTLLEVGVGPLVWYSFMSSNRFNDIVLSDLVEDNRKELEKWLNKSEDAIDWTYRAEQVAALEGFRETFDVVLSCNCLEGATADHESFRSVVKNVGSLVKPGGLFLLGGLGGLKSYFMGNANFIMANVTEDVIKEAVTDAGFQLELYRTKNTEIAGNAGAFAFILAARKP